ncbi:acylneuraminate cytidylyltransferase family protein [Magnetococcus sp. PR-3]|uniref:acylneuraminate cytidylyltransferase family protein n=1 Tax=Magnetococcus sp. PR-3 TaxID=3120355 RepID=UPI002FCE2814
MSKPRNLCLIPAKGGSTRLRQKNIRHLGGQPLIQWAYASAQESGVCDRIILSTESEEVARVARGLGLDVPFMRPEHLAKDPAGVVDVALHALDVLAEQGEQYERITLLLPTCPFRTSAHIREAYELFDQRNGQFLMSVSPFSHTPFAAQQVDEAGHLVPVFPEHVGKRSQQMPSAYRPNGAIHVLDVQAFQQARSYYAQPLIPYIMPIEASVDIDDAFDLFMAEQMLKGVSDTIPKV